MNVSSFIGQPRERFLEVRLFFETLLYHEIMQVPQYTLLNIMGIVGGQMGLYLGASILTISELAEFICIFILSATHRLLTCKRRLAH
ncbi:acid-sensing ion channel 4-A-like [Octopus bimaculoides]|uniref:acid-sensing ion channel 4-A-like n=1 Tax=Octopus bimaculoides TaxID=37653 RepID=UPI0022E5CBDC|nr:acid-sensing ion channel 4-A-like [Octopus bimaculoides]